MIWKVATTLALCMLANVRSTSYSEQKVVKHVGHYGELEHIGDKLEHHEEYAWSYPSYEFSYKVIDPHTHDKKGQQEERHGDVVKGEYWLYQPDGYKRIVKYHADKHSGFKADVNYEKVFDPESNKPSHHIPDEVIVDHIVDHVEEKEDIKPVIEDIQEEKVDSEIEQNNEPENEEVKGTEYEQEVDHWPVYDKIYELKKEEKHEPEPPKKEKKVIEFYQQVHHHVHPIHKKEEHVEEKPHVEHKEHKPQIEFKIIKHHEIYNKDDDHKEEEKEVEEKKEERKYRGRAKHIPLLPYLYKPKHYEPTYGKRL